MLLIHCPWCGPRDENEYHCGGQTGIQRPGPWHSVDADTWSEYLFTRDNPKGWHHERWLHLHGCRQWFNVVRNTVTHEIVVVYRMGDSPPAEPASDMTDARQT